MADPPARSPGDVLAALRLRRELNQSGLARELKISQAYVSKLESNLANYERMPMATIAKLGAVLRFKVEDWPLVLAGIIPPRADMNQSARDLQRLGADPVRGDYPIPVLGDVAAGGRNETFIDIENADEHIDAGKELAERYGISNLYALRVNGDSMYSERARFSVPDNSTLIIHRDMQPWRGALVVAYLTDLDLGVVKEYGEAEDVILSSYNPTGPIYRANQHHIRLCGVVVEVRFRPVIRNGKH